MLNIILSLKYVLASLCYMKWDLSWLKREIGSRFIPDVTNRYSYLNYCSYRREYRIWRKEEEKSIMATLVRSLFACSYIPRAVAVWIQPCPASGYKVNGVS